MLWLPNKGFTNQEMREVDRAVSEYDERLFFAHDPETDLFVIYIKMPHGQDPYPVCGFTNVPSKYDALKWLKKNDSRVHGTDKLWSDHISEAKKERSKKTPEFEDAQEEIAEAVESYARNNQDLRYWKSYSKEFESKNR